MGSKWTPWRKNEGDAASTGGPDFGGDWAWAPPAGARLPGEPIDETARRELLEETGLELACDSIGLGDEDWAVYVVHAPLHSSVTLDKEHDRPAWLPIAQAAKRCAPDVVRTGLERAAAWLESQAPR